jgi:hypothetical protein
MDSHAEARSGALMHVTGASARGGAEGGGAITPPTSKTLLGSWRERNEALVLDLDLDGIAPREKPRRCDQ